MKKYSYVSVEKPGKIAGSGLKLVRCERWARYDAWLAARNISGKSAKVAGKYR